MTFRRFIRIEEEILSEEAIREISGHLITGGIAVLPTETGYLLGVDGTNTEAIDLLFRVKGRDSEHSISLAVADLEMAQRVGWLSSIAEAILSRWSPGPVTVVVKKRTGYISPSLSPGETIGIRIPDQPVTLQVLRHLNRPITATSANRSGVVPKQKIDEIENDLSPYIEGIWAGVEGDERRYERPSTIVRVLENEVEILREGPISEEAILGELRLTGLL